MSRELDAFERAVRDRTDAARRRLSQREPAGLPPMPDDLTVCRWCGGKLKALLPGDPPNFCQNLCAPNDRVPYLGQCAECGKDFHTGKRHADVCYACEQKGSAALAETRRAEFGTPAKTRDEWAERRRARG